MNIQDLTRPLFGDYPAGNPDVMKLSELNSWPMMPSLVPGLWCCLGYLLFVLWLGPLMMNRRKPYSLKAIMMAYNLAQVVFSSYMVYRFLGDSRLFKYFIQSLFSPRTQVVDLTIELEMSKLVYFYLLSKYVEFLDTVFFVLRKKDSQVTFLHVYHHTNMAISTWLYLKYIRACHIVFVAQANLFVHAIMYGYYFLSSLGPWIRPYLWWKKYITKIQLAQFVLILAYVLVLILNSCPVQKVFTYYTLINTSSFLLLFLHFYKQAYSAPSSLSSLLSSQSKNKSSQVKSS